MREGRDRGDGGVGSCEVEEGLLQLLSAAHQSSLQSNLQSNVEPNLQSNLQSNL